VSFFDRLRTRLRNRVERPADQSVLNPDPHAGSEAMIEAESLEAKRAAATTVRRERARRTYRSGW
jgi:hypothetical protein